MSPADETHDAVSMVELDEDTCMVLLETRPVGRLAFVGEDGKPLILPVNHVVDEGDICFATGPGVKLDVAERLTDSPVAFEVDDFITSDHTGWSVVVSGRIEPVLDAIRSAHLDRTGHEAWVTAPGRHTWVRVVVDEISGRRLEHTPDD